MEIRSLSRNDFLASARALKIDRPELTQFIALDEKSFASVPGDTFGEMCDNGLSIANRETRTRQAWFGGQAAFTVGAGALVLPSVAALWHGNAAMWAGSPVTGLVVGFALYGASLYCRKQALDQQPVEEAAHTRSDRLKCWSHLLEEAERLAVEKNSQNKSSVERLADGLKSSSSSVLIDDESLRVGGVRVKRKK
jgi:hypothetical protein